MMSMGRKLKNEKKEKGKNPTLLCAGFRRLEVGGEVCTDWFVLECEVLIVTDCVIKEFLSEGTAEREVYTGTVERVVNENVLDVGLTTVVLFDESRNIHRQ